MHVVGLGCFKGKARARHQHAGQRVVVETLWTCTGGKRQGQPAAVSMRLLRLLAVWVRHAVMVQVDVGQGS